MFVAVDINGKTLAKAMRKKQKTKTIFKHFAGFLAIFLAFFIISFPVFADGVDQSLNGLRQSGGRMHNTTIAATGETSGVITDIPKAIGQVVGAILAFVGTLFFILIIYAGFTWMLARGNESEVQKAKDMLEAAVVGLIIVLSAYAITAYIGGQL